MTIEALEHLIRIAPKGAVITIVTIPTAEDQKIVENDGPPGDFSHPSDKTETPVQSVERIQRDQGNGPFKPKEWADLVPGVSVREIERAVKYGALKGFPKTTGRDHGATIISAEEMLRYLRTCERVQQGAPCPDWYPVVVKR
jgi:hypothetical protein